MSGRACKAIQAVGARFLVSGKAKELGFGGAAVVAGPSVLLNVLQKARGRGVMEEFIGLSGNTV